MTKTNVELIEKLFKKYYFHGYDKILSIENMKAREINTKNFIIKVLKSGAERCFILKEYQNLKDEKRLKEVLKLLLHCKENGLKVPGVVKTCNNSEYFIHETKLYSCFEFINGKPYNGSLPQLKEAAKALAIMHKIFLKYGKKLVKPNKEMYEFLNAIEMKKIENNLRCKTEFEMKVYRNFPYIKQKIQTIKNWISNGLNVPKQVVHNDYHASNVIFKGDKLVGILDFDSVGISERVRDVAFSCQRFSFYNNGNGEIKNRILTFIKTYTKYNNLTDEELNSIKYFSIDESLRRVCYILRSYFFFNDPSWTVDFDKHIKNIKTAEKYLSLNFV